MLNLWKLFWMKITELLTGHKHTWGKFKSWGIVYQERACTKCGMRQVLDM